jgi:hypothetical protein
MLQRVLREFKTHCIFYGNSTSLCDSKAVLHSHHGDKHAVFFYPLFSKVNAFSSNSHFTFVSALLSVLDFWPCFILFQRWSNISWIGCKLWRSVFYSLSLSFSFFLLYTNIPLTCVLRCSQYICYFLRHRDTRLNSFSSTTGTDHSFNGLSDLNTRSIGSKPDRTVEYFLVFLS